MKKILDYLYIFSKLSISIILLICLLFFGYFFYLSFNNQEKKDNNQVEFINKINENSKQLLIISNKFKTTNSSINEITEFLKINNNEGYTKELNLLNRKIIKLSLELESMSVNFQKFQTSIINNKNYEIKNSISNLIINKNKLELVKLVLFKFENSLDFSEELIILQNLHNEKNQHIFEKISLVSAQNYRGNIFLKKLFSQELDSFLKISTNNDSNNIIKNSIMKLILIKPSTKNIIKNNEINYLNEINSLLEQKKYKASYQKMININNYQKFFTDTLKQLKIAIEFKELIQKVG